MLRELIISLSENFHSNFSEKIFFSNIVKGNFFMSHGPFIWKGIVFDDINMKIKKIGYYPLKSYYWHRYTPSPVFLETDTIERSAYAVGMSIPHPATTKSEGIERRLRVQP